MLKQYVLTEEEVDTVNYDFNRIIEVCWRGLKGEIDEKDALEGIKVIAAGSGLHKI